MRANELWRRLGHNDYVLASTTTVNDSPIPPSHTNDIMEEETSTISPSMSKEKTATISKTVKEDKAVKVIVPPTKSKKQ